MPASFRSQAAHIRAAYTRETASLAAPGVTRQHAPGLDSSTVPQRRLRALLALGLFNHGPGSLWPRQVSLADVTRYTLVLSPRQDDLVVTTRAPYNVVSWLVGRDDLPVVGLPGLRVETSYEEGWRLRHLPTGATLAVTGDRHGRLRGRPDPDSNWLGLWGTDVPVSEEEYATLEALPRLSEEAETLLAALTVRLCARDPAEGWDIGMWYHDLSERPQRGYAHRRRLFAEGDQCELHWDSTPYPEDLQAALTHPVVGLFGATSHPMPTGWKLRYGHAALTAHPHAYQPCRL
ncbi:hypothetical protein RPQ02_40220 [Streptomyces sp. AM2-3-1]|uniref:hypothetical protein n=1 Tax=Streptomyces sp. AM2-3-1 TaxID=3075824 RepID=UPI0028C4BC78|nr:hypothetical protein [Streptomyces sp. AM2-3-1]WNO62406.1 hypothetical protein RPQ02_00560 [Streptomyces sp. AM2-3-1]WNO69540.1 hypothetical protein RPQ02_40220 [Streptomyces sp. AM2-3-1]